MFRAAHKSNVALCQPNIDQKPLLIGNLSDKSRNFSSSFKKTSGILRDDDIREPRSRKVRSIELLDHEKPAQIIVLRDCTLPTSRPTPKEAPPEDVVPIDIMDQLGNEIGAVKDSEVRENIENLRPKNPQVETWEIFNELVDQLAEGFTSHQLEDYMARFNAENPPKDSPEPISHTNDPLISSITPWRPNISSIHKYFDNDPARGYLLESRTLKQRIATRLLRECWNIELTELLEEIGQFEIQLRADVLELLLSGNPSPLQKFYDDVLTREDESLEVFCSRNVLRFSSADSRKSWIVEEFEKLMQRLEIYKVSLGDLMPASDIKRRSTVLLDAWTSEKFNDHTLVELKRLTGVTVTREAQGKILLASFLDEESSAQQSPIDDARRLLLTARPALNWTKTSLASTDISEALPLDYFHLDSLNWWCRIRHWFRWASPIMKATHFPRKGLLPQSSPIHSLDSDTTSPENKIMSETPTELIKIDEANPEIIWSQDYTTNTSATMGAIIHNFPENRPGAEPIPNFDPRTATTEFSTHVPNVTRLLSSAQYVKVRNPGAEVVLKFLPNPFFRLKQKAGKRKSITAAVLSTFPPVEIVFRTNLKKEIRYSHTRAIVRENRTDIMLPQEVVDIQIRQITYSLLLNKVKGIKNFVSKCELNLQPGGNINIPPTIILPISSYLCKDLGDIFKGNKKTSRSKKKKEPRLINQTVEYLFAGLEIQNKLTFNYDTWHINYTYVDAGRSGGRRGELSLRPIKDHKGTAEQEFIDFSLELACRLTSLSTPELTRFREISKIPSSPVRRYYPIHESTSKYPRNYLYIPRRILKVENKGKDDPSKDDSNKEIFPDFEEVLKFEHEVDDIDDLAQMI
ncbi:hypothetical protein K3495_g10918 [Podosphaera aphanis]|nr:hypothetical protein K3495_g10918 [Podosphaera aphanis]